MNETTRTATYAGIAAVLALIAFFVQPQKEEYRPQGAVNEALFKDFKQPGSAASLEIVRYSEDIGEISTFEVAKDPSTGRWQIPSHSNYPADAENQMRNAATMFIDLKALGIASEVPEDHKLFGVLEPDDNLKAGDEGVGLKVVMQDDKSKDLVALIIGKKVKGTDNQRFVRIPGQDVVYTASVDPEKLSVKFEDWIEKDLLKLNAFDVEQLKIRDYSVVRTTQGFVLDPKLDVTTRYDSAGNQWKLEEFVTYKGGKPQSAELLPEEELNKTKLDEVKNALDDVKIVDVVRKPKGLGADLQAGRDFMSDEESIESLFSRGFFPFQPNRNADPELRAANGELHVGMKDGIEYILRFGNVAPTSGGESKLSRYLFVTARLDESKFPEPMLEPLPDLPGTTPAQPPSQPPAGGSAAPAPSGAPAAPETPPAAPRPESPPAPDSGCGVQEDPAAEKDAAPPAAAQPGEPPQARPAEENPAEEKPADEKPEAPAAGGQDPAAPAAKPAAPSLDEQTARIKAERERIEKENQRKLNEHQDRKKKAAEKVQELNARFGDWYYVISEDEYKKLRLSRADLIKEREGAQDEGFGVDAFRKLEEEGLEKKKETGAGLGTSPPGGGFMP